MPKPVCVKCQRFYRPLRNAVDVLEQMPNGTVPRSPPGTEAPETWEPYKLWSADKWHCEGCDHELVVSFAQHNYAEHYQEGFQTLLDKVRQKPHFVIVNDC